MMDQENNQDFHTTYLVSNLNFKGQSLIVIVQICPQPRCKHFPPSESHFQFSSHLRDETINNAYKGKKRNEESPHFPESISEDEQKSLLLLFHLPHVTSGSPFPSLNKTTDG
ncbi:hypothetical protein TNCV_3244511 [Trichonephila clavipes]|nr:hypothetical protein TNCV_3244511 [Trichonephila clavipes]